MGQEVEFSMHSSFKQLERKYIHYSKYGTNEKCLLESGSHKIPTLDRSLIDVRLSVFEDYSNRFYSNEPKKRS